jgi:DNA replication protein DnaC
MQQASSNEEFPSFVRRLGTNDPAEIEALRWTCEVHGVMEPRLVMFSGRPTGRYARRGCSCAEIKEEQARRESEQRQWMLQNTRRAYGWLGGRWTDREMEKKTFANFDTSRQSRAYEMVRLFEEIMAGALVLYGPFGTGKTHLLASLCNALLARRIAARFTTAPKLFAAIQAHIAGSEDYSYLISDAIHADVLAIDDVDKAKRTDFREEVYFNIIDERVKSKRPIALSTNRLTDLEQFVGGACVSRLSIGQIAVEMTGKDYRLEL